MPVKSSKQAALEGMDLQTVFKAQNVKCRIADDAVTLGSRVTLTVSGYVTQVGQQRIVGEGHEGFVVMKADTTVILTAVHPDEHKGSNPENADPLGIFNDPDQPEDGDNQ